jgi:hypothetical protein
MATILTKDQWIEILSNDRLKRPLTLRILQAVYDSPGRKSSSKELAIVLSEKWQNLNLEIADRFVKNGILKYYQIELLTYNDNYGNERPAYYAVPFELQSPIRGDGLFDWVLRPELALALEETGIAEQNQAQNGNLKRTFLYTWNPAKERDNFASRAKADIKKSGSLAVTWRSGRKDISEGDRIFLIRLGRSREEFLVRAGLRERLV